MLPVGPKAQQLIVTEEIGSAALYEAEYQHPVWPGGASGVTIGIGYDLGRHTPAEVQEDWGNILSPQEISILVRCCKLTGDAAHAAVRNGLFVTVTLANAMKVFLNRTLPQYAQMTEDALDNCAQLPPDAFGALVSITYNRGASGWNDFDSPRHTEMAGISDAMDERNYAAIPDLIRHMKRLWPVDSDLWNRRLHEADLFQAALGT